MLARRGLTASHRPLNLWHNSTSKLAQPFRCRTASASNNPATLTDAPRLEDWLRSNGGTVSNVELVQGSHLADRRLTATADAAPGTTLISVPKHLQLRYDNVNETSDAKLLKLFSLVPRGSDTGGSAWQFKQALLLLHHLSQGRKSPLHDYISHLPGLAPGIPTPRIGMLMSDSAVLQLQYTPLIQDVLNHKYWWEQFSSTVLTTLPNTDADAFSGTQISKGLFGWAVSVVISRCFGLNATAAHTMVPLIDMANHSPDANCEMRSGPDGQVNMLAKKEIKHGDTLLLTYGGHDNHNLLLSYGFVLPDNANERYTFELDNSMIQDLAQGVTPSPSPLRPWQLRLLHQLGFPSPTSFLKDASKDAQDPMDFQRLVRDNVTDADAATASGTGSGAPLKVHLGGQPPVDPRLMAALRVATLGDDAQAVVSGLTLEQLGRWEVPLARQHELSVLKLVQTLVTELYRSFPTTIQQDRQLLAKAKLAAEGSLGAGLLRPAREVVCEDDGSLSWAGVSSADQQQQDLVTAISYRLGLKLALERCLKAVVERFKGLDELQTVR